jgi:hypothetical protein
MLAKPSRRPRHGPRRPGAGAPLGWSRSNACPLRPPVTTFGACTRPGTVDAGGGPVQSTLSCARSRSASPVGGKCGSSPVAADVLTRARTAGHRPGAGTATLAAAFRCRSLADDGPAQLGIQVLGCSPSPPGCRSARACSLRAQAHGPPSVTADAETGGLHLLEHGMPGHADDVLARRKLAELADGDGNREFVGARD